MKEDFKYNYYSNEKIITLVLINRIIACQAPQKRSKKRITSLIDLSYDQKLYK